MNKILKVGIATVRDQQPDSMDSLAGTVSRESAAAGQAAKCVFRRQSVDNDQL
jgi:hypothetical protein